MLRGYAVQPQVALAVDRRVATIDASCSVQHSLFLQTCQLVVITAGFTAAHLPAHSLATLAKGPQQVAVAQG